MNRKQKLFALLAVMAMGLSGAASAEPFNRYFTAQGALADVDGGFDNGLSAVVTYGIRVPEMHKNFSVETEFTTSVFKPERTEAGTTYDASYYTLAGYGVYSHPLNNKFHLRGRAGILYSDIEAGSAAGSGSEDAFDLSFGFGVTVNMSKTSRFILEYTVVQPDITHISAGMQFKL